MKIKNVLQIGNTDLEGGKFNGHDLHKYLQEKGIYSCHLVVKKESDDSTTIKIGTQCKKRIPEGVLSSDLFWQSDVVHMHLIHDHVMDISALPILSKIRPLVWTLHDPWCVGGGCIHHFDCVKWQSICHDCEYLNVPYKSKLDDRTINFLLKEQAIQSSEIAGIVASKWMENMVAKSPIWKGKNIYHIPFGVNQDLFHPSNCQDNIRKSLGIRPGNFVLLLRATRSKYKGLETIRNALKSIDTENITILTVDKTGLLDEFKEKYQILDFGWVDGLKLRDLYQSADVFLMPSEQEAFGLMAVEAMSCGCCPVVIEGTALPEVVHAPEYGVVTTREDYAKTLHSLIKSPDWLKNRGLKCHEYACKEYDKDVYVSRLINCYEDVVSRWKLVSGRVPVSREYLEPWMLRRSTPSAVKYMSMLKYACYDLCAKISRSQLYKKKADKYRIQIVEELS